MDGQRRREGGRANPQNVDSPLSLHEPVLLCMLAMRWVFSGRLPPDGTAWAAWTLAGSTFDGNVAAAAGARGGAFLFEFGPEQGTLAEGAGGAPLNRSMTSTLLLDRVAFLNNEARWVHTIIYIML